MNKKSKCSICELKPVGLCLLACSDDIAKAVKATQKRVVDDVIDIIEPEIKLLMSYFDDTFSVNLHRNDITSLWNKWQELRKRYDVQK